MTDEELAVKLMALKLRRFVFPSGAQPQDNDLLDEAANRLLEGRECVIDLSRTPILQELLAR